MSWIAVVRTVVSLLCAGVDCWAGVSWAIGSAMTWADHLGPSEYLTIIFVATAALITMNHAWVFPRLHAIFPSGRLTLHSALFDETMNALELDHPVLLDPNYPDERRTSSNTKKLLHKTNAILDKLRVPHPEFRGKVLTQVVFLSRLTAAAELGELKWARRIWPEMEAERDTKRREQDEHD